MYIYLILQLIIFIIYFPLIAFLKNKLILNIIIVLPIAINAITALINKQTNSKLKIALCSAIIADYFFMFPKNFQIGIAFFIVVQIYYMLYIRELKINIYTLILIIINYILALIFKDKYIIFEGTIYGILTIINITTCLKFYKQDKNIKRILPALILLFICDFIIFIRYFISFNAVITLILQYSEWISYIPSQFIIVLLATNNYELIFKKNNYIKQ